MAFLFRINMDVTNCPDFIKDFAAISSEAEQLAWASRYCQSDSMIDPSYSLAQAMRLLKFQHPKAHPFIEVLTDTEKNTVSIIARSLSHKQRKCSKAYNLPAFHHACFIARMVSCSGGNCHFIGSCRKMTELYDRIATTCFIDIKELTRPMDFGFDNPEQVAGRMLSQCTAFRLYSDLIALHQGNRGDYGDITYQIYDTKEGRKIQVYCPPKLTTGWFVAEGTSLGKSLLQPEATFEYWTRPESQVTVEAATELCKLLGDKDLMLLPLIADNVDLTGRSRGGNLSDTSETTMSRIFNMCRDYRFTPVKPVKDRNLEYRHKLRLINRLFNDISVLIND